MGAVAAASVLLGLVMLMAALQSGLFNGLLPKPLSALTGRQIAFRRLRASVFSLTPTFTMDDLSVGSPPAITQTLLLTAAQAVLRIHPFAAVTGAPRAFDVVLTKPSAHLVRLGPGRNNYTFGKGGSSTGWRRLGRLEMTEGRMQYDDPERHLTLSGAVTESADPKDARPLRLTGGGVINGEPFTVTAAAASLAGRDPALPYPFETVLQDGQMHAALTGTSGKPFDFRQLNVQIEAAGPNMANFTYLFEAPAPNTRAFSVSAHFTRSDPALTLTDIRAKLGDSDLRGSLSSDHRPGARRTIQASLQSNTLYLRDLELIMQPNPSHAQTRERPAALPARSAGGRLFSATPFEIEMLRRDDVNLQVAAARLPDAPFTVSGLDARLVLQAGRLSLTPVAFSTAPGRASASFVLDASLPTPAVSATVTVRGARLARLKPSLAPRADADLDLDMAMSGSGVSPRAVASRIQGRLSTRLSQGRLQKSEAAALGGDLIKAIGLSLADKTAQAALDCAVLDVAAASGRLQAQDLDIVTSSGWARGSGDIDLASETVSLVLQGTPAHARPFQVNAPVHLAGPLAHPAVRVDPVKAIDRLAATLPRAAPSPPAPDCKALLARSAAFAAGRP